uniref:Uncharacterized protein n=1 Tax=Macrostomum lignano TaxID=282301 RepID=A0A1I8GZH8_9PLAT
MPVEDFRPELKHVEPEASNFKRLLELRKVERSEELESKINRPKPSVTDILRVERESDLKARLFRDPEVEQAELMYTNVQANLRGGHYAGMLESQQHGLPQQNQVPQHQQQLQQQPQQQHSAAARCSLSSNSRFVLSNSRCSLSSNSRCSLSNSRCSLSSNS